MLDLHTHVLPGMDDGSRSVSESRKMLAMLAEQGVTAAAATPHFYAEKERPEQFLERRSRALETLAAATCEADEFPTLIPGAEVRYYDGIHCSDVLPKLQLGSSGLILIEMPFQPWSERMLREILEIGRLRGLTPVLAHIERYLPMLRRGLTEELRENGVLLQCNASFLLSLRTRRQALRLWKSGTISFLGSDCHNLDTRRPNIGPAASLLQKKIGSDASDPSRRYFRSI